MRGFSRKRGITQCPVQARTSSPLGLKSRRLSLSGPNNSAYGLEHTQPCGVLGYPSPSPLASTLTLVVQEY